jgi:2-desacetyl-2-hydroxyethyl bacteriochlorophyllide A dehydrogenase
MCGTDLHVLTDGPHMMEQFRRAGSSRSLDFDRDIVLGHEFCCEIVDYGPETPKSLKPGTRVTCLPVGIGLSNTRTGGLGELMVLDVEKLLEIKNGLRADHAALTEPMAVGLHAVAKAKLGPDDLPLVIGCGPVGLAVIAALKVAGAQSIVAADFSPARRDLARIMGADFVVDPANRSPFRAWEEQALAGSGAFVPGNFLVEGKTPRSSVIFECAGVPGILQSILEGAPVGARIVMVGACARTDTYEPMIGTLKEVSIQFAVSYTAHEFAATLQLLCEGTIDVSQMITTKVGAEGVAAAFEELADPARQVKVVVEPWR